jgi:hypothetical protein
MVYQLFLDPPKFPLKRGTLTLVPPFLRVVRGDHEVPKITIQNFSNTLSHPKSDRTPPHSQKAIASHIPKAIALLHILKKRLHPTSQKRSPSTFSKSDSYGALRYRTPTSSNSDRPLTFPNKRYLWYN